MQEAITKHETMQRVNCSRFGLQVGPWADVEV
jgi:hypothetical protein